MLRMACCCRKLALALAVVGFLFVSGCDDSKPRAQIDDTVKELAGQKQLERFNKLKDDVAEIQLQQADRLKQMEK